MVVTRQQPSDHHQRQAASEKARRQNPESGTPGDGVLARGQVYCRPHPSFSLPPPPSPAPYPPWATVKHAFLAPALAIPSPLIKIRFRLVYDAVELCDVVYGTIDDSHESPKPAPTCLWETAEVCTCRQCQSHFTTVPCYTLSSSHRYLVFMSALRRLHVSVALSSYH